METDIKHSALGDLIRRHLELHNLTQAEFAKKADMSTGSISSYLSGREVTGWFKEGHLEKLATALGLPARDVALARVADLGYDLTEKPYSPHESLLLGMLEGATDEDRERVLRTVRAVLGD